MTTIQIKDLTTSTLETLSNDDQEMILGGWNFYVLTGTHRRRRFFSA